MDTAGKAVLFSGADGAGLAERGDARAEPRVPLDEPSGSCSRSIFVLAATLTLLPAVLAKLGPQGRQARAAVGALRRAPLAALRGLGRAAVAPARRLRRDRARGARRRSRSRSLQLKTGMPSIKVVPSARRLARRLRRRSRRRSVPARPGRCRSSRARPTQAAVTATRRSGDPGIAAVLPARSARRARARDGDPQAGSVRPRGRARRSTACARSCRRARCVGGAVGREPRPRGRAVGQDAARHRRRARARLPAAAVRAAGAADRRRRRAHQPAGHRRRPSASRSGSSRTARCSPCSASSRRASWTRGGRCSSSR